MKERQEVANLLKRGEVANRVGEEEGAHLSKDEGKWLAVLENGGGQPWRRRGG